MAEAGEKEGTPKRKCEIGYGNSAFKRHRKSSDFDAASPKLGGPPLKSENSTIFPDHIFPPTSTSSSLPLERGDSFDANDPAPQLKQLKLISDSPFSSSNTQVLDPADLDFTATTEAHCLNRVDERIDKNSSSSLSKYLSRIDELPIHQRDAICRLRTLLGVHENAQREGLTIVPEYWKSVQEGAMRARWRKTLVEWLLQFPTEMAISNFSVMVAVNMMDRYFSKVKCMKEHYQLVALICAFISSKLHDSQPLTMTEIIEISSQTYSVSEIKRLELKILQTLEWKLLPATTHEIAYELLRIHTDDKFVTEQLSNFINVCLDIQLLNIDFLKFSPPLVALVSLRVAFRAAGLNFMKSSIQQAIAEVHPRLDMKANKFEDCNELMWRLLIEYFPHMKSKKEIGIEDDCAFVYLDRSESPTSVADLESALTTEDEKIRKPSVNHATSGRLSPVPCIE
eukprot:g4503.t1